MLLNNGSGSPTLTNGSRSRRPKNIRIRRIRICQQGRFPVRSEIWKYLSGAGGSESTTPHSVEWKFWPASVPACSCFDSDVLLRWGVSGARSTTASGFWWQTVKTIRKPSWAWWPTFSTLPTPSHAATASRLRNNLPCDWVENAYLSDMGTASRGGFDFWWRVFIILGLNRGRGHFLNLLGARMILKRKKCISRS